MFLSYGCQPKIKILWEDHTIIVVNKPSGQLVYGSTQGLPSSLADQIKEHIRSEKNKTGRVFLGVVHRLDRPVSGVVAFARNSKFAGRMSQQFAGRDVSKRYIALLDGTGLAAEGELVDHLRKLEEPEDEIFQECRLHYRVIGKSSVRTLVDIELHTGRRHQIRRQFALRGMPILGDVDYQGGAIAQAREVDVRFRPIALHAYELGFAHPLTYAHQLVRAPLPHYWQQLLGESDIENTDLFIESEGV